MPAVQKVRICRMILTVCPLPLPFPNTFALHHQRHQHLSSLIMFALSFFSHILFSLSVTFPLALSSYLRLTAPVRASLISWCLRVCLPSPLNQRRSALFLPRGSAPSVRARTAWLTATRSETCNVWEDAKSPSESLL